MRILVTHRALFGRPGRGARTVSKATRTIGEWKVPRTEVLVVLKFLAAVSPVRNRRKGAFL